MGFVYKQLFWQLPLQICKSLIMKRLHCQISRLFKKAVLCNFMRSCYVLEYSCRKHTQTASNQNNSLAVSICLLLLLLFRIYYWLIYCVFPENGSPTYLCTLGYIDSVDLKSVHWRNSFHDTSSSKLFYRPAYNLFLPAL